MSREIKAAILALAVSLGTLSVTFSVAGYMQRSAKTETKRDDSSTTTQVSSIDPAALQGPAKVGYSLFDRNCAHCHGDDARGDEGPTLYDLTKSDARITKIVRGGIKGEMPKFGTKFSDDDIRALIAFLRTLKT